MLLTTFPKFYYSTLLQVSENHVLLWKNVLHEGCPITTPLNNKNISGFSHVTEDKRRTTQMLTLGGSTSSALNYYSKYETGVKTKCRFHVNYSQFREFVNIPPLNKWIKSDTKSNERCKSETAGLWGVYSPQADSNYRPKQEVAQSCYKNIHL